jgi:riboflavin synthase
MFTGIVEEIGKIKSIRKKGNGLFFEIEAPKSHGELKVNDSVAINGVCQTVIKLTKSTFIVEAVEETLKKTTFNKLRNRDRVNIELSMKADGRFGGHIVLGHVDTVGEIVKLDNKMNSILYHLKINPKYRQYVVAVGSITIDGISLTLAQVQDNIITVSIIPHTQVNTIIKSYKVGTKVNIEFDILGKYIERILKYGNKESNAELTRELLVQKGF